MSKSGKLIGLPIVNARAAGIDIGSRIQVASVPPELSDDPVRTFQSFTADIEQMANWLVSIGITTVAMESTGVYWIPVYEILEAHGLTGPGLAQPELEPDEGLGTTPGGQVELFHENSIACVAVIMAVMRG